MTRLAWLTLVAICLTACGSNRAAPAGPTPGGETSGIFAVLPNTVVLGEGDRGWQAALFAATVNQSPQDVTAATRWESANPAVVFVQGSTFTALSPGEVDLRASYQRMTASTHVSVFPASALRTFSMPAALACWPGETFSWNARATLDSGAQVSPTAITWRSLDERMASVTTREQQVGTGTISTEAEIACRSAGTAGVEAVYAGRVATTTVTVRAPRDLIELRGASEGSPAPGVRTNGVTLFYVLDSAPTATIRFESRDASDLTRILAASTLTVQRGGATVHMENRWQGPAVTVCEVVDLIVPGGPSIHAAGTCSPPALQK